jgi:hypothetical protein
MSDNTDYRLEWLDNLPPARRAQALSYLSRIENTPEGDILAAQASLMEATGMGIGKVSSHVAASAAAITQAAEKAITIRDMLDKLPVEVSALIVKEIKIDAIAKGLQVQIEAITGKSAITQAAVAATAAVGQIEIAYKKANEVISGLKAQTMNLTESSKAVIESGKTIEAQAGRLLHIAHGFSEILDDAIKENRWLQWGIVAAVTAFVLVPLTWEVRGCFLPTPPPPDIVALAHARGGALAVRQRSSGELDIAFRGAQSSSLGRDWQMISFPSPESRLKQMNSAPSEITTHNQQK